MKKIITCIALLACASLTGCASIVNGTSQPVSVSTSPVQGATCTLKNNKGVWYINKTPGSVIVHRCYHDLTVTCSKKGYKTSTVKVKSHTKGMAFGNAVFGGGIGAGVDIADGAAYDYPTNIQVPMKKITKK